MATINTDTPDSADSPDTSELSESLSESSGIPVNASTANDLPGDSAGNDAGKFKNPLWIIATGIVFVGLILAVLVYFDVHRQLLDLINWIDQQGMWAAVLFIGIMALVVVLLLPGVFLTTGAGFVFGVVEGTIYVLVGSTIGAGIAFLIARYLFGKRASNFVMKHGKVAAVNDEMAEHDFMVVMLTRLIPFFPGKLANYFFGLTSFSFSGFILGTFVGFFPLSLHNVYLGSITANLAGVGESGLGRSPLQWGLYGLGFIVTIAALVFFNKLARRALTRYSTAPSGNTP